MGEPLDEAWSSAQEDAISNRLGELENPFIDSLGVECQSSCCKMSFRYEYLGSQMAHNRRWGPRLCHIAAPSQQRLTFRLIAASIENVAPTDAHRLMLGIGLACSTLSPL